MELSDRAVERLRRAADLPDFSGTRYRVLEELGRGGMGTVYLAKDRELDRNVALKVLHVPDAEAAERMLREARIIARLEHPGIVPVHDAGRLQDDRVFYAMKLVRGRRLDEVASEPSALAERLRLYVRICEAVAFAHAQGVVHRDLKPANVMVGAFGEVLVIDWGVAKVLDETELERAAPAAPGARRTAKDGTAEGTVVGTAGYMSPEQSEGRTGTVDARTDVYALGAILHFLVTGRAPDRLSEGRQSSSPRESDPEVPRALDSICRKALSREAADRYTGAEALAREVSRFLDGEKVEAHRETLWERIGRIVSRYRTPLLLVLTYLVVRTLLIVFAGR